MTFLRQASVLSLGFISMPLTARLLEPSELGALNLLFSVNSMSSTLGVGGVVSTVIYFRNNNKLSSDGVDPVIWKMTLLGSGAGLLLLLVTAPFLYESPVLNRIGPLVVFYSFSALLFAALKTPALSVILADKKFRLVAVADVSTKIVMVVGLLGLFFSGRSGLSLVLVLSFATSVLSVVWLWLGLAKSKHGTTSITAHPQRATVKDMFGYAWKTSAADFIARLNYRADTLLLTVLANPIELGLYAIGVGVAEKLWIVSSSVAEVSFTYFTTSADTPRSLVREALLTSKWTAALTFFPCVCIGCLAPFFGVIFGSRYAAATTPLLLLIPGIFTLGISRVISNAISAMGSPMVNAKFGACGLLLNLCANFVLIPRLGAAGAALATSISYTFMLGLRLVFLRQRGHSLRPLFLTNADEVRTVFRYARTMVS